MKLQKLKTNNYFNGASSFMEIEEALKLINKYHNKVIILHCYLSIQHFEGCKLI